MGTPRQRAKREKKVTVNFSWDEYGRMSAFFGGENLSFFIRNTIMQVVDGNKLSIRREHSTEPVSKTTTETNIDRTDEFIQESQTVHREESSQPATCIVAEPNTERTDVLDVDNPSSGNPPLERAQSPDVDENFNGPAEGEDDPTDVGHAILPASEAVDEKYSKIRELDDLFTIDHSGERTRIFYREHLIAEASESSDNDYVFKSEDYPQYIGKLFKFSRLRTLLEKMLPRLKEHFAQN